MLTKKRNNDIIKMINNRFVTYIDQVNGGNYKIHGTNNIKFNKNTIIIDHNSIYYDSIESNIMYHIFTKNGKILVNDNEYDNMWNPYNNHIKLVSDNEITIIPMNAIKTIKKEYTITIKHNNYKPTIITGFSEHLEDFIDFVKIKKY